MIRVLLLSSTKIALWLRPAGSVQGSVYCPPQQQLSGYDPLGWSSPTLQAGYDPLIWQRGVNHSSRSESGSGSQLSDTGGKYPTHWNRVWDDKVFPSSFFAMVLDVEQYPVNHTNKPFMFEVAQTKGENLPAVMNWERRNLNTVVVQIFFHLNNHNRKDNVSTVSICAQGIKTT